MWAARNGSLARQTENLVSSLVQPRPSHGQCMPETEHRPPAFDMLTSSEQPDMQSAVMASRCFQLVLIKPSHYDDDGYVIRWWRAMIPSNSLAAVYAIAADCAERKVLGPDVAIDIEVIDETNTRLDVRGLLARFRRHCNFGLVALVGVQSNQYPRALDIARAFRVAGIPVAMGGFHVSGCLSMLDGHAVELDACRKMGIAMFAGEAEGRLDKVLRDAAEGALAAGLQLHEGPAGAGGHARAVPPEAVRGAHARPERQFRRGPRLPVSVLVLHDHQRAGSQVALPFGRRRRASGAPQLGARHSQVLHHRR